MTGPKRMRPESAEADSELAISYVVEPERRMSDLSRGISRFRGGHRPTFSTRQLA